MFIAQMAPEVVLMMVFNYGNSVVYNLNFQHAKEMFTLYMRNEAFDEQYS